MFFPLSSCNFGSITGKYLFSLEDTRVRGGFCRIMGISLRRS